MKSSAKKLVLVCILALCAAMLFFVGCSEKKAKAQGIRVSEPFENGATFEFTDSVIELPYGIAYDKDGKDISLDLTYTVFDKDGKEVAKSNDSIFDLDVGEYTIRYTYQDVKLEISFAVVDTIAPSITFTSTNTGSMALYAGDADVSASLPKYEISDYSACSVTEKLTFVSDDGTYNGEEYDYDKMGYVVEADRPGTFTYTITATDASGNSTTESVEWRCKDGEWLADDVQGDMVSSYDSEDYLDSVLNGQVYTEYTTNGNYYAEYLDTFEGANGVVKVHTQFNTRGYSDFRFKLGKPVDLKANKNRYLVVRMFIPDAEAFGSDIQIAGNTVSKRNFTNIVTVQEHALTRWYSVMTDNVGVVSGRWFSLSIPVSQLITLECSDQVKFEQPTVSDEEWFKDHTSYNYASDSNLEGMMHYLQFTLLLSGSSGYQDFYIDSIFLADRASDVDASSFTVDFANKTISWDAVAGAEYYNVFDASGALVASVDAPSFQASGLGEFSALRIVSISSSAADSAGVTITPTDLDITFQADGSWAYTPQLIAESVSVSGNTLTLTLNKELGEGALDISGITATDTDGEAVTLQASVNANTLVLDISGWAASSQYKKEYVRIEAGSTLKVGETEYFFNQDIIIANLFGGWELVTESEVVRLEISNGSNHNLRFYTYDADDAIIAVPGSNLSANMAETESASTLSYSGSFTVNGVELDTLISALPNDIVYRFVWAYVGAESGSSGVGMFYFQIMARIGDNWAWNLEDLCKMTGSDGVEVEILGGTSVYMKFGESVYCLRFADTYTFTKASVTQTTGGWSVVRTEGAVSQQKNYLVTLADEEGTLYAGQVLAAGEKPDFDAFAAAIGSDAQYIEGYYDGDTKIDTASYTVQDNTALTVKFDYPYLYISGTSLSADGNALTLTVNKELSGSVEAAEFDVEYADGSAVAVTADLITVSSNTITLNIADWKKSTAYEKSSVTIKAGSAFTVGGEEYSFVEDVTLVNLLMQGGENTSRTWEILEKAPIGFTGIELRNNTANKNLCFYFLDQDGARISDAGLNGLNGYYFASVSPTTAMDYSGSVTINGVEVGELLRQIGDNNVFYVLALRYENGLFYFQLLNRTSAGAWTWNLEGLTQLLGSETISFRIAAGTDLYLRNGGNVYAFHFAETYEFTKASAAGNGDWSMQKLSEGAPSAHYLVKLTDEDGTLYGGQVVAAGGTIDFAKAFGSLAQYIDHYVAGDDQTQYVPGDSDYTVSGSVTVKVIFEYRKAETIGQTYTIYTEESASLDLSVLTGYYFQDGVAADVTWELGGTYGDVEIRDGALNILSPEYVGTVNLKAKVHGLVYDVQVSVLVSEQDPVETIVIDGALKTDATEETFYTRFTENGTVLAKGAGEEISEYVLGSGFSYSGSIRISGIELTDFAGLGYEIALVQDTVGYAFEMRQTGTAEWQPITQDAIRALQSSNQYPECLLVVEAGTNILLDDTDVDYSLAFSSLLVIVKNGAPSVAANVAAIGDTSTVSKTNFCLVLQDANGNNIDSVIKATELYYNGNQPASATNKATFYYFGSIKICGVELSELLTSDQAKENGSAIFGTRYGGWARLYCANTSSSYEFQLYRPKEQNTPYNALWNAFNGYDAPTLEFAEGTILFVTNANTVGDATVTEYIEFGSTLVTVKTPA